MLAGSHWRGVERKPYYTRKLTVTLIYRRTKNLRAVQLLLGHTKRGS